MAKDLTKVKHTLFMCSGGTCTKNGAEEVAREIRCAIKMAGLHESTHTTRTLCQGQCENGPVIFVAPDNIWYKRMDYAAIETLIDLQLAKGSPVPEKVLYKTGDARMYPDKVTHSKTKSRFVDYEDKHVGAIRGASIYPWEFNIYPLLKEIFIAHRTRLAIWVDGKEVQEQTFNVCHAEEKARVLYADGGVLKEVVMKTNGDRTLLPRKVSTVKLYHRKDDNKKGIYMATPEEGVFLKAEWNDHEPFWEHVVRNYALITPA